MNSQQQTLVDELARVIVKAQNYAEVSVLRSTETGYGDKMCSDTWTSFMFAVNDAGHILGITAAEIREAHENEIRQQVIRFERIKALIQRHQAEQYAADLSAERSE